MNTELTIHSSPFSDPWGHRGRNTLDPGGGRGEEQVMLLYHYQFYSHMIYLTNISCLNLLDMNSYVSPGSHQPWVIGCTAIKVAAIQWLFPCYLIKLMENGNINKA